MHQFRVRADSFVLKSRRIRIYRVKHREGVTVYWTSAEQTLRYLNTLQLERLQAKQGR